MKFIRFGNAFVAKDGETLYVVSYYLGAWAPYYLTPGMKEPERVGKYGYSTPQEAQRAAHNKIGDKQ